MYAIPSFASVATFRLISSSVSPRWKPPSTQCTKAVMSFATQWSSSASVVTMRMTAGSLAATSSRTFARSARRPWKYSGLGRAPYRSLRSISSNGR